MTKKDFELYALEFHRKQAKFKAIQDKFEEAKKEFYGKMDNLFKNSKENNYNFDGYKINKIQRVDVKFNVEKLEKRIDKNIADAIIEKEYLINDMQGLINYLKSCNVDPKIFKSFIQVSKKVNVKELEKLEELGDINIEDLKGCYTTELKPAYYTIKETEEKGETD